MNEEEMSPEVMNEEDLEERGGNESPEMTLLRKIQQHLTYLERKIDSLIGNQSQSGGGRPFNKPRHFSKPGFGHSPRPHGEGPRHHGGPRDRNFRGPREGNFSQERPAFRRDVDGNRDFGPKKKRFFHRGQGPRRDFSS